MARKVINQFQSLRKILLNIDFFQITIIKGIAKNVKVGVTVKFLAVTKICHLNIREHIGHANEACFIRR